MGSQSERVCEEEVGRREQSENTWKAHRIGEREGRRARGREQVSRHVAEWASEWVRRWVGGKWVGR